MSTRAKKNTVNRIIDANINRAKEGLRVCEEITRFILNHRGLTLQLKTLRHAIALIAKDLVTKKELLQERSVQEDVGRSLCAKELNRESLQDIFFANIQRSKESVRVLEEFSKLININSSLKFKKIRYKIYALEKKVARKFS